MRNTAIVIFILLALLLMACSDDEVTGSEVDVAKNRFIGVYV